MQFLAGMCVAAAALAWFSTEVSLGTQIFCTVGAIIITIATFTEGG